MKFRVEGQGHWDIILKKPCPDDNSTMSVPRFAKFGLWIAFDSTMLFIEIQGPGFKVKMRKKILSDNNPTTTVQKRAYNALPSGALVHLGIYIDG